MRNLLLLLLLFVSVQCFAQKSLLFYHTKKNKTIVVKEGTRVSLLYKGYRGQQEFVKEVVTGITDSTITLGVNLRELMPGLMGRPGKVNGLVYKVVKITDITGFRKMGVGRQAVKSGVAIAGVVGSFYLLRNIYSSNNISTGGSFLISLGMGFGLITVNELLFPENIKYYMEDGWSVQVVSAGG